MGNAVLLEPGMGAVVMNDSDVATSEVIAALDNVNPLIASMARWSMDTSGASGRGRQGGLLQRDRYVTPQKTYEQIARAQEAVSDDDVAPRRSCTAGLRVSNCDHSDLALRPSSASPGVERRRYANVRSTRGRLAPQGPAGAIASLGLSPRRHFGRR